MNTLIKYGQCKKLGCAWPLNKDKGCDKCNAVLDKKIEFIKAIESIGVKYGAYKLRVISNGKYGKPEAWIYNVAGKTKFDFKHGLLIEDETIKDKEYLREYLSDFIQK